MSKTNQVFERFKGSDGLRLCREGLRDQRIVCGSDVIAKELCKKSTLCFHRVGETIIKQKDGKNDIVFILAGKVSIVRDNRVIAHRSAGDSVGEMSVIDCRKSRSASVMANEDCVVASVSEADFSKIAQKFPDLWRCLAKQVSDRLRERLEGVRPRNMNARIFIGSSSESKKAAKAVEKALAKVAETVIWTQPNVFEPGKSTLESLDDQARRCDFALMVFAPDDLIFSRRKRHSGPRDNVIFELGLFMGALNRTRAFVISPCGMKLKIPTDLLGVNFVSYSSGGRVSLEKAIYDACGEIRNVVIKSGPI